jgi:RNA polymerase sigma factor (sigma-70 family)
MTNTPFKAEMFGLKLPREVQFSRMRQVIQEILSPAQREVVLAYHFHGKSIPQIARERGVQKSTVWRTLRRAEHNLLQHLKY